MGVYQYKNGQRYEGMWKNNKYHGHGTEIMRDGAIYSGNFKDGLREGLGEYITTSRELYKGEWHYNSIDGHGEFLWPDGRSYEG